MKSFSESYKAAGVDVTAGYKSVELMKQHVARTKLTALFRVSAVLAVFCPKCKRYDRACTCQRY